MSSQWSIWVSLNDNRQAASIHVSNNISFRTDLLYKIQIFDNAYGISRKSRWRSWMINAEEVKLYLPKITEMIYMPQITSRTRRNVIWPHHLAFRSCGQRFIRHWKVTTFLNAIDNPYNHKSGCRESLYYSLCTMIDCMNAVSIWLIWPSRECQWLLPLHLG